MSNSFSSRTVSSMLFRIVGLLHDLLHPFLFQPPNLPLEVLDLLPAVQRATIVGNQAPHDFASRLFDAGRQFTQLFPCFQSCSECFHLLGDFLAVTAYILLCVAFNDFGGLLLGGFECLRFLRRQLLELLRYTCLYGEFEGLSPRRIGLNMVLEGGVVIRSVSPDWITHLSAPLKRFDNFL